MWPGTHTEASNATQAGEALLVQQRAHVAETRAHACLSETWSLCMPRRQHQAAKKKCGENIFYETENVQQIMVSKVSLVVFKKLMSGVQNAAV